MIELEIAGLPKIITNGSKGSWRAAWGEARKWHREVHDALVLSRQLPPAPFRTARLTLVRCSLREPDADNLYASFKHVVDGLVKAGVLENDKPSNLPATVVRWQPARRNQGKIKITVECLDDTAAIG
jgi:hypothetical protein